MSEPAITAQGITVRFRPYTDRSRSRRGLPRRKLAEVVALNGVSCTINRGEAAAIIGGNGAGKSTLLRVLAGTLHPDSGSVEIRASQPPTLLELGVAFNGKLSGMHNVYLGGLALGHKRADLDELLPEIEDFAGIGEAIHRPVNTYSSGMRSRLAFAIAMTLEPEIVLLDELLAVGDAAFKEKSMTAMQDLVERAGTVVMVSHSLSQVKRLCQKAIWIERGRIVMQGPVEEVVDAYRGRDIDEDAAVQSAAPPEKMTARQRSDVVRRLLSGENAADVAVDTGIDRIDIVSWRRRFLEGGRRALRRRLDDEDDE